MLFIFVDYFLHEANSVNDVIVHPNFLGHSVLDFFKHNHIADSSYLVVIFS